MWILTLGTLIVISAAIAISADRHGSRRAFYVCKPLTIVLIILLTMIPKYPVTPLYRYLIVAGLIFSLVGDIFLMLPRDRFMQGLISFLIAHLFYIAAFTSESGWRDLSIRAGIPLFIYAAVVLWWLWSRLEKLKVPVMVYMLVILVMTWTALNGYLGTGRSGSLLAAVGAVLFMSSDSFLAVCRFRGSFPGAQLLILATYFTAQYLIALST